MIDPELDLPFLQRLLLCGEVENIRIGDVVCIREHGVSTARTTSHNILRQIVELLVVIAEPTPCVQHMIVVSSVVESDQSLAAEFADILRIGIDQRLHRMLLLIAGVLEADHEQVRKHLDIIECQNIGGSGMLRWLHAVRFVRTELHVRHYLHTIILVMSGVHGEIKDIQTHVLDIILDARVVCFVQQLADEVDRRLGPRTIFLS